jgi:hypothetical protein
MGAMDMPGGDEVQVVRQAQAYATPFQPEIVTVLLDGQAFNLTAEDAASLLHQLASACSSVSAWKWARK